MRAMLAAIAVLAALGSAFADDRWDKRSGGLVLLPLDDELTVEGVELMLSPGEIRLTYRIHNAGETQNLLGITFPMPDVRGELFGEADYAAAIPDGFRLTRDGRPVEGTLHQYVTALGVDRTDIVRELGLPLNPAFGMALGVPGSFEAALNPRPTLTAEQRDRLLRLGMIRPWIYEIIEGQKPPPPSYSAMWTMHSSYTVEQTFEPGERAEYVLTYPPAASTGLQVLDRYELGDYCPRSEMVEALRSSVAPDKWISFDVATLDFSDDNSLNGPIGAFRLVLDAGEPGRIAATCWEHPLRRTGPARFEAVQTGENVCMPRQLRVPFATPSRW